MSTALKRRTGIWRIMPVVVVLAAVGLTASVALAQNGQDADVGEQVTKAVTEMTANGHEAVEHESIKIPIIWWLAPIGSIIALVFAGKFYGELMKNSEGDDDMKEIAAHVRDGAYAYLRQQYKIVALFFVIVCILLAIMAFVFHAQHSIVPFAFLTGGFFSGLCGFLGMKTATNASARTTAAARESLNKGLVVALRAGAVMGLVVVGFGLLDITGWFLALSWLAPKLGTHMTLETITVVMLCFGMGASAQALFARVGGGIYTKAADVGADLVGKVEAGIPEDDPRNPATIADNVGDNVGDVAGMGADLYESYCGSILATAALGVAAASQMGLGMGGAMQLLTLPMVLAGLGIIMSIIGIYMIKTREGASMADLLKSLMRGIWGSSVLVLVVAFILCYLLLGNETMRDHVTWWGVWLAVVFGTVAGLVIGYATEYYTSYEYKPTQDIARQADTGPATVIIAGIAEGMKSTWAPLATIIVAILCAFGFAGGFSEFTMGLYGVGIAAVGMLSTLGMTLATDAYGPIADNAGGNAEMTSQEPHVRERTDALDSLGNTTAATGKGFAIGSAALTALALLAAYVEEVRVGIDRHVASYVAVAHADDAEVGVAYEVDHGKFALITEKNEDGTYEVAGFIKGDGDNAIRMKPMLYDYSKDPQKKQQATRSMSLIPASHEAARYITHLSPAQLVTSGIQLPEGGMEAIKPATMPQYMNFYRVTLMNPKVLCGMFAGVLLVFLFCSLTMKAVGRAAGAMVMEVRRQFKEIPGIMEGTSKPDYARCVAISTAGAQREMIVPSLLAIVVPILVGLIFSVEGVMGLLAGGLTSGFAMAIMMANAGGAWDNAKKWIETGQMGGKGSEAHKAGVVGDTVGDPFKDTSGPSLNILIKLMSMVSIVFAGMTVKVGPWLAQLLGMSQ